MNTGSTSNQFFITEDGSVSIISGRFGERYHSRFGAVAECQHISILHGFKAVLSYHTTIDVLEIGFGTGLNTWLTNIEANRFPQNVVKYHAVEGFPLTDEEINNLNYEEFFPQYSSEFRKIHSIEWNSEVQISPNFFLIKVNSLFEDFPFPHSRFNLVLYDPFAPGCQPEMWGEKMMEKMFYTMALGGLLVTYCAQGAFRRALKSCGFTVEKLPGPPGKREMTRAVKNE